MSRSYQEAADSGGRPNTDEPSVPEEVSSSSLQAVETEKSNHHSPEHSYTHSRSQSTASALSSSDYMPSEASEMSRTSGKPKKMDEIVSECSLSSTSLAGRGSQSGKASAQMNDARVLSLPVSGSGYDETTSSAHVDELVQNLNNPLNALQTAAASEIWLLAKHNLENRIIIGKCEAVRRLTSLLHSDVRLTQEHAVTALLNLSLNEENKARIAAAGVIEPLIHVLRSGTGAAKEKSAATLFSLSS